MTGQWRDQELIARLRELDSGSAPSDVRDRILRIPSMQPAAALAAPHRRRIRPMTLLPAAALLAIVGAGLIAGGGSVTPVQTAPPTAPAVVIARSSPSPSVEPTVSPTGRRQPLDTAPRMVSLPDGRPVVGSLPAGQYALPNPYAQPDFPTADCPIGCSDYVQLGLTLPDGWAFDDDLHKRLGRPDELSLSAWTIEGVYLDACHWKGSPVEALGHQHVRAPIFTSPGLSRALAPGREQRGLRLDGQIAELFELLVPPSLDLAACDEGRFRRWRDFGRPDTVDTRVVAGQTDLVYLVDVDRSTLVIKASLGPDASDRDRAELDAILDSLTVER
jgi:hypothetical protein